MSFFKKIFSSEKKETAITEQAKETLDKGLEKTKTSFFSKLTKAIAGKSKVDDEVLDNLEEILVSSDVEKYGMHAASIRYCFMPFLWHLTRRPPPSRPV